MTIPYRHNRAATPADTDPSAERPNSGPSTADAASPTFLFSIDLEDVRTMVPDGMRYRERVPHNTERLLDFLDAHESHCTFFTVGDVARRYPELVRRIADAGHEIACHGDTHAPLDRLDPRSFRADLERCLESFAKVGVTAVKGFRAPMGSLTASTSWAYAVLRELGFEYSSSVHATRMLLYGWPEFGDDRPRRVEGIWELPPTLTGLPLLNVPLVGGIFFRLVPFPLTLSLFRRRLARQGVVVAYLHPYDVDHGQERFMHPGLHGSRLFNSLMFWNRKQVFRRLEGLFAQGATVIPFAEYVANQLSRH